MAIRKPYKIDSDRFIFSVINISLGARDWFYAPRTSVVCYQLAGAQASPMLAWINGS